MPARFNLDMAGDVANAEGLPMWHLEDKFRPA
jgi:hypothetical protein